MIPKEQTQRGDNPDHLKLILKLVHVIKKIIGSQFLILVAGKEHFQYCCPIKAHCFKLYQEPKVSSSD